MCLRGSTTRRSRYCFTWRSSLSTSWSIDSFMSWDASRARSVGPFVKIVPSATLLSAIEGLRCSESSTSTCVGSARSLPSFASFFSAYSRIGGVTSTFLPFT